ncbi:MAG: 3-carboxy-cis,cis-muconate cycloisomerase, partial [Chloroflexi bacterium]|nr:3-carboxy-cis,cis-muconate cycloisomerase [Chloroflexota bacterium]
MMATPELGLLGPFGDPAMAEVFSHRARLRAYLEIEVALARVQAGLGVIPDDAADAIEAAGRALQIDADRLLTETRLVGYPILPLLDQLREAGGPDVAAYAHWGATTQDIMDSGLALQMQRGLDRIESLLVELGGGLGRLAEAERATVMAGRTHAQPAVPTTFGAKIAVWVAECARHVRRVRRARTDAAKISLFGAGGTSAALG